MSAARSMGFGDLGDIDDPELYIACVYERVIECLTQ
jgi:hypothetical protein